MVQNIKLRIAALVRLQSGFMPLNEKNYSLKLTGDRRLFDEKTWHIGLLLLESWILE